MFRERFLCDHQPPASALPQHTIGRLGFLSVVLVSGLFYAVIGPVLAGERLIALVEVRLTEFTIEMPTAVPPGQVTFSVTNAGTREHNFGVVGEGIDRKFDTNLKPGETRNLQVDLPVGVYTVYCTVDDHKERGMHLELRVAQQQTYRAMPLATSQVFQRARALGKGEDSMGAKEGLYPFDSTSGASRRRSQDGEVQ